jgi:hypothetical protein
LPHEALALSDEILDQECSSRQPELSVEIWLFRALLQAELSPPEELARTAARALELAMQYSLAASEHVSRTLLAWARFAGEPAHAAELWPQMRASIEELSRRGHAVRQFHGAAMAARVCAVAGEHAEGLRRVDRALAQVELTGARLYEAELWRCRAAVVASCSERQRCLERAGAIAARQGAVWWELRALCDRVESAPSPDARKALRALCAGLGAARPLPDLQRACRLLGVDSVRAPAR